MLSTGDEVREPGQPLQPGRSTTATPTASRRWCCEAGGIPKRLGIAKDTVEALTAKLREGLDADMLVTSAGVSRGDYDVVKDVLAKEGEVDFWTVRMRPGKPLAFGAFPSGGRARPAHRPAGQSRQLDGVVRAVRPAGDLHDARPQRLAAADRAGDRRRSDREQRRTPRVRPRRSSRSATGSWHAALTGPQGSGILTSMADANALAIVPEDVPVIAPGRRSRLHAAFLTASLRSSNRTAGRATTTMAALRARARPGSRR